MSWLYSINHPYPRHMCCIVQHSAALLVRYPSLLKEFTSLLWAQIFCEKKFEMYWKFLRKKFRNVLENCVEKISKCTGKLCRKIVTRIRVWARIELFYTNTNHYHYHSRSRSHAPIQCNTAPIQCKRAKIPTFCTVPRGTPHQYSAEPFSTNFTPHQYSAAHCSTWNNTSCKTWHDYCTERFCTICYNITIPWNAMQCYTVLYVSIQCYTVLYRVIQCYTVQKCAWWHDNRKLVL